MDLLRTLSLRFSSEGVLGAARFLLLRREETLADSEGDWIDSSGSPEQVDELVEVWVAQGGSSLGSSEQQRRVRGPLVPFPRLPFPARLPGGTWSSPSVGCGWVIPSGSPTLLGSGRVAEPVLTLPLPRFSRAERPLLALGLASSAEGLRKGGNWASSSSAGSSASSEALLRLVSPSRIRSIAACSSSA